ncbi:unnamed protein product, partial [Staurois parvus]
LAQVYLTPPLQLAAGVTGSIPFLQSCAGVPTPPLQPCAGVPTPPLQPCAGVPAPPLESCTGVPAPPLQPCAGVPAPLPGTETQLLLVTSPASSESPHTGSFSQCALEAAATCGRYLCKYSPV